MTYRLWLLTDPAGQIALTGWSDSDTNNRDSQPDHWPAYPLCQTHTQLTGRLTELGIELAPGADLNDLNKHWDVYVRHPDINTLRKRLGSAPTPISPPTTTATPQDDNRDTRR